MQVKTYSEQTVLQVGSYLMLARPYPICEKILCHSAFK